MSRPSAVLMTDAELRRWFRQQGLPAAHWPRLHRLDTPVTFTAPPGGDYWTVTPLITGAFLVVPGLSDECPQCSRLGAGPLCKAHRPQPGAAPRPKAWDVKPADRARFFGDVEKYERPCEYGHGGCSDRTGGACSDELQGLIEAEEGSDPDEAYAGEGDAGRGAVQTTGEHLRRLEPAPSWCSHCGCPLTDPIRPEAQYCVICAAKGAK